MSSKFILQQEDGTVANGDARGTGAVDLQMVRSNADQVNGGYYSSILGGHSNLIRYSTAHAYNVIAGGLSNLIYGSGNLSSNNINGGDTNSINGTNNSYSVIGGGRGNTVSSAYSIVSGGQSNTASTNTHATVVGGASNTASGQYSIAGGHTNVASGARGVAFGYNNTASGAYSVALGSLSQATNLNSIAIGGWSASGGPTASGQYSVALGYTAQAVGGNSVAIGAQAYASGNAAIAFQNARAEQNHSIAFGHFTKGYFEYGFSLANGRFAQNGDAQISFFPRKTQATLTSGGTTTLNGGTPEGNRAWNVTVKWVAIVTAITGTATGVTVGDAIYGTSEFGFKRLSGTSSITSLIRDSIVADTAIMETATLTYSAGASQELALTFTAPTFSGGGDLTVRVVAKVELTEVAF